MRNQPEEGKTTVTTFLALTMMLAGKQVLVIDADWRKPRIHEILRLENARGVADLLTGNLGVQDVIQVVEITNQEHKQILSAITSGKVSPHPFGTVASPALAEAVRACSTLYDDVLIDSPPVLAVNDSLLLAPAVDGVVLVLNTGVVTEKDVVLAKERLERGGAHIVGVVMNRFEERLHGPGFHPYRRYHSGEPGITRAISPGSSAPPLQGACGRARKHSPG